MWRCRQGQPTKTTQWSGQVRGVGRHGWKQCASAARFWFSQTRRDVLRCGRASQQDFSHPPTRRETVATYWTKRISVDPEAHELLTRLSRQGKSAAASQCCIDSSRSCGLETEHLVLLRIWSDSHLHNTKENCEHNPSWLKLSKLGYPAALRMS